MIQTVALRCDNSFATCRVDTLIERRVHRTRVCVGSKDRFPFSYSYSLFEVAVSREQILVLVIELYIHLDTFIQS